jgi:hypothetical protein
MMPSTTEATLPCKLIGASMATRPVGDLLGVVVDASKRAGKEIAAQRAESARLTCGVMSTQEGIQCDVGPSWSAACSDFRGATNRRRFECPTRCFSRIRPPGRSTQSRQFSDGRCRTAALMRWLDSH